jgi:peptidoglycan hydrolase CwlO-like protein
MENKKIHTFLLIFIASYVLTFLIIWYGFKKNNDGVDAIKEIEKRNLALQKSFDSLSLMNKKITFHISSLSNHIDSLKTRDEENKKLYDKNESEISKLKKKISDLPHIDTFTTEDIKRYFTNLPE